ncbi:MAG TPA: endonuclease/exonuclease/phosphatase family protein, partial [Euzebya sp.]|nr:endonuclease/exonuclease/phosphatase family protein [Euzebya sp.]
LLSRGQTEVRPGHVDLTAAATWIASLDADVVALQEVDAHLERSGGVDQVAWLAERLGCDGVFAPALMGSPDGEWDEAPPDGLPEGAGGYGVGLLSRIGLHAVTCTRLPYGGAGARRPGARSANPGVDSEPRVALSATVGDDVRVSTTHLSYMFWRAVPQLGRALEAAAVGHPGPGVFVGDLNLPMWGGWLALHARGLHPWGWPEGATRASGWRYRAGAATYPSWKPRLQLDQVLLRNIPHEVTVTAGARGPSDHLPLIVQL